MNKKTVIRVLAIIAILFLFLGPARSQEEYTVLNLDALGERQRPVSAFDHDAHMEYEVMDGECYLCHHLYEDGKLVPEESSDGQYCSECHGLQAEGRTPGLVEAYHRKCKSCHEAEKKGPLACGQCHIRP